MGGSSKIKGSRFERECCVALSLWVTDGEKRDCFWRSAMSGGRATVRNRDGATTVRQVGDICTVAMEGLVLREVYMECKFHKSLRFDLFCFGKGPLATFWRETMKQAKRYALIPVLIARQNNTPTILLTTPAGPFHDAARYHKLNGVHFESMNCWLYPFDDLLNKCRFILSRRR